MKGSGSLQELVELLVKSLVDRTEDVSVEKMENSGSILFEVSVHPDELGKVIGRQGRVIKAIRTLVRSCAPAGKKSLSSW